MRFLRNLFVNARKRVGPEYPLGIRLSGDEQMENGLHPEEVAVSCQGDGERGNQLAARFIRLL